MANERERDMKLSTAFKTYPKAIGWSVVLSSCIVMEGYGTAIVGSCKQRLCHLGQNPSRVLESKFS